MKDQAQAGRPGNFVQARLDILDIHVEGLEKTGNQHVEADRQRQFLHFLVRKFGRERIERRADARTLATTSSVNLITFFWRSVKAAASGPSWMAAISASLIPSWPADALVLMDLVLGLRQDADADDGDFAQYRSIFVK